MADSIWGCLLALFLLALAGGRIFFIKYERIDSLASLAPLALATSILQIFAWGLDFISAIIFVLALVAVIGNMHALGRLVSGLYVDHYSLVFIIFSVILFLCALAGAVLIIMYAPVSMNATDYGVSETKTRLQGSFADGFAEAGYFSRTSALLYEYAPLEVAAEGKEENAENDTESVVDNLTEQNAANVVEENAQQKSNVVFILGSDKRGDAASYRPYMLLLAQQGYTVITCDFFTRDGRWFNSLASRRVFRKFAMILSFLFGAESFSRQAGFYTVNMTREYEAMLRIAEDKFGDAIFFLVSDGMADDAAGDVARQSEGKVAGVFALDSVDAYATSGFGFIEQTDPPLAAYFGFARDTNAETPRFLVSETLRALER